MPRPKLVGLDPIPPPASREPSNDADLTATQQETIRTPAYLPIYLTYHSS